MYELNQVGKNTYYIESPAKVGLVRLTDREVCLIDSGSDKDAGRKIRQILERENWQLKSIFNTHSNADHIGGNKYLQDQTNCRIFAPGVEADFTNHPILEPAFLYGGCPPKELRHKFLLAQPSRAEVLNAEIMPEGLEFFPLPGHFFDMVGFCSEDDVMFMADCLSSAETLEKYQIGFIYDVAAYLKTLEWAKGLRAKLFVFAHAAPTEDIAPLAQLNINKVMEIAARIEEICREPASFEDVLKALFDAFGLSMNFQQYALVGCTLRSYLSWMKEEGRLTAEFLDNRLMWRRAD